MNLESLFGMTAFTQHALEELRKMESEKVRATKAAELRKPARLTPLQSPQKEKPSIVQAQQAAARLQQNIADSALVPVASPSPTFDESPKKMLPPSPATETFHHKHLVEKRRTTILRLEKERLEAIEEAKREAERQEATRQKRLDKQYKYRVSNLQRIVEQLDEERAELDAEFSSLKDAGLVRPPPPPVALPEERALNIAPGHRVRLLPLHIVQLAYMSSDLPMPVFPEFDTVGTVLSNGARPDTICILFGEREFEILKSCVERCPERAAPSAPLVVKPTGEGLQLASQKVTVEVIGDLAVVTHSSEWCFDIPFDCSLVDLNAFINDEGEHVAMIIPTSSQMTITGFSSSVCGTKLRSTVLSRKDVATLTASLARVRAKRATDESPATRSPALTPRALSPRGGGTPTSHNRTPRAGGSPTSRRHHPQTPPRSPRRQQYDADALKETMNFGNLTFSEFDAIWAVEASTRVWADRFGVSQGPCSQEFSVIPLQTASKLRPITCELTYIVSARAYSNGSIPAFSFSVPCTVPEYCTSLKTNYDNISSFDVFVEGFANKTARVETYPSSKIKKGGAHSGVHPPMIVHSKTGVWKNHNLEVAWAPERIEEIGVNAFAETNPSSVHTDTFMIIVSPPLPQPGDTPFRHSLCIVLDMSDEVAFCDTFIEVRRFVEQLQSTDLVQLCFLLPQGGDILLRQNSTLGRYVVSEAGEKDEICSELNAFYAAVRDHFSQQDTSEPGGDLADVLTRCTAAIAPKLLQRQKSLFKKMADSFREVVLFTDRTLTRETQRTISLLQKHHDNSSIRFSVCVLCRNPSVNMFWRGVAALSHGHFCQASFDADRVLDIASFMKKLCRPIFVDVEVSFLHTTDLQCFGGIQDLRAESNLVICGRYSYNAPAESLNESVGISGRLAKGRAVRKRVLCAKIGLPLTRLCQHRLLMHQGALSWMNELVAPGQYDSEEITNGACHFGVPVEVPAQFFAPAQKQAGEETPKNRGKALDPHGACASLCVYHSSGENMREVHHYPPFLLGPSPGLVAPGNASSWAQYNETKVKKDLLDNGCFACVAPYVWSTSKSSTADTPDEATSDFRCRLVEWFQGQVFNYDDSIRAMTEQQASIRNEIEEDEWMTFLSLVQLFHNKRVWITQQDAFLAINVTHIEESARVEREAIILEERVSWSVFLDETQTLRAVMRRVNVFAEEHRKRLSYAEEGARAAIAGQQAQLWTLGKLILSSSSVSTADVEFLITMIDRFISDPETLEFIACMVTVWTLTKSKAEVIGLQGGISKFKSLLQQHCHNETIVEFSLAALYNFAQVRTTHGKLESCSAVVDVMDTMAKHFSSRRVIFGGVRCLTILGQLSQNFRRIIISSPNGLMFIVKNFSRFAGDLSFCTLVFRLLSVVAMEPTAHRTIVEMAMRTLTGIIIMRHRSCDALLQLFFKTTAQLASSRALRMLLAIQGMPTAAMVVVLSNASACSTRTLHEALRCAEKMCGNLNDYPAIILSLSLFSVLDNFLAQLSNRQGIESLLETAQRLLSRLSLSHGKLTVDCDEILKPLYKPWSALKVEGVVGPNSLRSLYGAVCLASLDIAGFSSSVLIRVFSYHELCEYLPEIEQVDEATSANQSTLLLDLYGATLSVQLQDVLVNAFISHPSQLKCLGFTLQDGIHATIYERTPSPSLEFLLLHNCAPRELFIVRAFTEVAFTLFDVAAYFSDCNAVHGLLSLWNIFPAEDGGVVVGPAAHLTPDIVAALPQGQRLFDRATLEAMASRTAADDIIDATFTLVQFLNGGMPIQDTAKIVALLPDGLAEALRWPELLHCTPAEIAVTSATIRESIGQWMMSPEAAAVLNNEIPISSANDP